MRIGQRANILRATANTLLSYGRHKGLCQATQEKKGACDCGWEKVRREANAALATEQGARKEATEVAHGRFELKRDKPKRSLGANPSWRAEFLRQVTLALLVSIGLAFALPAYAQSASRCWQPIRPVAAPKCADSLAVADTFSAAVPFTRPIATGMQSMVATGDTIPLQATMIRGYLFVGPTKAGHAPNTLPGTVWLVDDPFRLYVTPAGLVMGLTRGRGVVTAVWNGKKSTTEVIVSNPRRPVELPRVYVDTRMPATPGTSLPVP